MSGVPEIDAERKILDWCGHLAVPKWVDEKSYSNCKSCSKKMDALFKQDRHHCRLCGQMFCSACTGKYHVPLIFRIKNKDGPARVCFSCVEGCMSEKSKAAAPQPMSKHADALQRNQPSSLEVNATVKESLQSLLKVTEIAPPQAWQEEAAFAACPKCRVTKVHSYNCRVCGIRYCDKCTSKMDVPRWSAYHAQTHSDEAAEVAHAHALFHLCGFTVPYLLLLCCPASSARTSPVRRVCATRAGTRW